MRAWRTTTTDELEADRPVGGLVGLHLDHFLAPDEIALVQVHGPTQSGLVGADVVSELLAIERHAGFEAEGIAGAESHRNQSVFIAGVHQPVPDLTDPAVLCIRSESVLPRVAKPCQLCGHAGDDGIDPGEL